MTIEYGSQYQLGQYLVRHRPTLDARVLSLCGAASVSWIAPPPGPDGPGGFKEWKGLEFIEAQHPVQSVWREAWPQRGNPPNWDAVGKLNRGGVSEWLLVEAKANEEELRSSCGAKPEGGRSQIERALEATKSALGVAPDRNWLDGYYQYCNRLAVLNILTKAGIPARLLFIYFTGDTSGPRRTCPASAEGWNPALAPMKAHVGLPSQHMLADRIHELFLDVSAK